MWYNVKRYTRTYWYVIIGIDIYIDKMDKRHTHAYATMLRDKYI